MCSVDEGMDVDRHRTFASMLSHTNTKQQALKVRWKFLHFCVDACNFCALVYYIVKTHYNFEIRDTAIEREFICDYHDILTKLNTYTFSFLVIKKK